MSGASIKYQFVAKSPSAVVSDVPVPALSKKRKAQPAVVAEVEEHTVDQTKEWTEKVQQQQEQINELLEKLQQSTATCEQLQTQLNMKSTPSPRKRPKFGETTEESPQLHSDMLNAALRCAICHDVLIDPVVLSCSHGFCLGCIAERQR